MSSSSDSTAAPLGLPPRQGIINRDHKRIPTFDLPPDEQLVVPCMSLLDDTLAEVLEPLRQRVVALPANAWTRAGQAEADLDLARRAEGVSPVMRAAAQPLSRP